MSHEFSFPALYFFSSKLYTLNCTFFTTFLAVIATNYLTDLAKKKQLPAAAVNKVDERGDLLGTQVVI